MSKVLQLTKSKDMKTNKKQLPGAFLGILTIVLILLPQNSQAKQNQTRYNPCVCYTYFSDGTIETGASCDSPSPTGTCAKLVMCLPKNKEDQ